MDSFQDFIDDTHNETPQKKGLPYEFELDEGSEDEEWSVNRNYWVCFKCGHLNCTGNGCCFECGYTHGISNPVICPGCASWLEVNDQGKCLRCKDILKEKQMKLLETSTTQCSVCGNVDKPEGEECIVCDWPNTKISYDERRDEIVKIMQYTGYGFIGYEKTINQEKTEMSAI